MDDSEPGKESSTETEKILVSLANPDTIEDMMNLSLVIRDTKLKDNLLALHVINDDSTSDNLRMRSKRYLEKAAMTTTAANVSLKQLTRYDLNIASGIIHSVKENEVTSIITGLHRKANITDSYFGMLAGNLLKESLLPSLRKRNMNPAFHVGWNISAEWEARSDVVCISLQTNRQPSACKRG